METKIKNQAAGDYCLNLYQRQRLLTREVNIGGVPMGGTNPIRIQSMTTTDSMDTEGTIQQTLRMVRSGAEYVRITAPSKKEAENLRNIRDGLRKLGCNVPLVADIHFTPNAAEIAARIVEKVRVNPGNYADKKKFEHIEYTDKTYDSELQRIYDRFSPLVKICKEEGTVMRIGTNHGSLSDRIMSRYGDTPLGMVESAMEFLRICEDHQFYDLVISMKASNPQVMVQAYRLLAAKMKESGNIYPLHLGVTEAGEGEDGRIKSALGISTLLMDGLGDTVRVSLTEEPEYESPVAKFLVDLVASRNEELKFPAIDTEVSNQTDPFEFERRETIEVGNTGGHQVPVVVMGMSHKALDHKGLADLGYTYSEALDKYNFADMAADYVYMGDRNPAIELPGALKPVFNLKTWKIQSDRQNTFPYFADIQEYKSSEAVHSSLNFLEVNPADIEGLKEIPQKDTLVLVFRHEGRDAAWHWRLAVNSLAQYGISNPVIYRTSMPSNFDFYNDDHLEQKYQLEEEAKIQLQLAAQYSTLVVDGQIDGIWIDNATGLSVRAAFGILQAGRMRITKTEYISCPSCGRTLFDLQETTAKIRKRTEHLKGVKIGIMGCIVNGPGEMADADYGYVGVGPDKIALYRGKEVVERGVKTEFAVDKLIELIQTDGNWIEPA